MISLNELDSKIFNELIRDLINADRQLNLNTYKGTSAYKNFLWQTKSLPNGMERIICDVKQKKLSVNDVLNKGVEQSQTLLNTWTDIGLLIVVTPQYLNDKLKKEFKDKLNQNQNSRVLIEIIDAFEIERLLRSFPDILKRYISDKSNWHEVYNELSNLLYKFHSSCFKERKKTGRELFQRLISNEEFKKYNKWIDKFQKEFGVESIDPFHIFFSINANTLSPSNRWERINILFSILESNKFFNEIDYIGCPAPAVIKLLGARKEIQQQQIWDVFARVQDRKRNGLKIIDFQRFKSWYGVEYSSFTTFLFWTNSDYFLPIETNVRSFLMGTRMVGNVPKSYHSYLALLKKIDNHNYDENERYESRGLFREISSVAYQIIGEGKKNITYSKNLQQLIELNTASKIIAVDDKLEIEKSEDGTNISSQKNTDTLQNVKQKEILEKVSEASNLGFKLIAIKALEKCDQKILNVLKKNKYYYFEKTIEIKGDAIFYHKNKNLKLYSKHGEKHLNFTAIVGKNGSGKSSLIELLFRIINNISYSNRKTLKTDGLRLSKGLYAELYYTSSGFLNKILLNSSKVKIQKYELVGNKFLSSSSLRNFTKRDFNSFFYTIAVNYSHYALNCDDIGLWINGLFHKNDGYQTPIVINPMREGGVIDIKKENDLVNSRLIANLLSPVESTEDIGIRQLTEKQKAEKIRLTLLLNKSNILYEKADGEKVSYNDFKGNEEQIWNLVKKEFKFPKDKLTSEDIESIQEVKKYIIRKLIRIAITYYKKENYYDERKLNFTSQKKLRLYIKKLRENPSHITFKLKQAINYWKYPKLWQKKSSFEIDIFKDDVWFQNFMSTTAEGDLIEYIPPAIFSSEIILVDESGSSSSFKKLSSGEKHLIHSVSSLLYHLKNINSVEKKINLISYGAVNVLLDEIELYYHPELQRVYINYLITMLRKIEIPNIDAINFCLVTHSPYILSDISDNYTLKLDSENNSKNITKTFGSNIHDLLANNFFMENGFMGEWAKNQINETIQFLNFSKLKLMLFDINIQSKKESENYVLKEKKEKLEKKIIQIISNKLNINEEEVKLTEIENYMLEMKFKETDDYEKIIKIIGEPVIQRKLQDMFDDIYGNQETKEIKELKRLAKKLDYKLEKNN